MLIGFDHKIIRYKVVYESHEEHFASHDENTHYSSLKNIKIWEPYEKPIILLPSNMFKS